ncbi:MAG: GNAT family N-acetyltransferase [Thalassobaculum sp.]|uniref:GNAT family N-acetyltransferase n=1 Tax=Thalassobaculum sp. TaxID=2022740 RepID=UPI0032EACA41
MTEGITLTLRLAEACDADDLLAWRNDPVTRTNSRNTAEISRESHDAWLLRALADANRRIWIAERGVERLGTVSAVRNAGGPVELSITVAPAMRGRGVGAVMLHAALAETARIWPGDAITAMIRPSNGPSLRLFERCGFVATDRKDDLLIYRWRN